MNDEKAIEILRWLESSLLVLIEDPSPSNLAKMYAYMNRMKHRIAEAIETSIKPEYRSKISSIILEVIQVAQEKEEKQ